MWDLNSIIQGEDLMIDEEIQKLFKAMKKLADAFARSNEILAKNICKAIDSYIEQAKAMNEMREMAKKKRLNIK